jgi:hypothetical protein
MGRYTSSEKVAEKIVTCYLEYDMLPDDVAEEVAKLLENGKPMEALRVALRHR